MNSLKATEKILSLYRFYVKRTVPIVILAPGRVGSMALHKDLKSANQLVFKMEFFDDETYGNAKFAKTNIFMRQRPAKIISIVRDPMFMMSSYFFSKAQAGHLPNASIAYRNSDVPLLQKFFVQEVLETSRLDKHLYWFENDYKKATGIDVFAHAFDHSRKFAVIQDEVYPTLIFRTEITNDEKTSLIRDFLKIKNFEATRDNTREQKQDGDMYKSFLRNLRIPETLLKKIYSSPVSQHFLSANEIEDAYKRFGFDGVA